MSSPWRLGKYFPWQDRLQAASSAGAGSPHTTASARNERGSLPASGKGRVTCVLGMHRSGTSAVARGLEVLGIGLGTSLIEAGDDNPKGYWEDAEGLAINKAVLEWCDIAWNDLRIVSDQTFLQKGLHGLSRKATDLLRARVQCYGNWGFKDPRTVRVLPFWLHAAERAGVPMDFVVVLRHPLEVAESLRVRNRIPIVHGLLMWAAYVLPFLPRIRNYPHVFMTYDDLLDNPEYTLRRMASRIGSSIDEGRLHDYVQTFLSRDLRHHVLRYVAEGLRGTTPDFIEDAYRALLELAECPDALESWDRLMAAQSVYCSLGPIWQHLDTESDRHRKKKPFWRGWRYG